MTKEHVLRARLSKLLPLTDAKVNWGQAFICPDTNKVTKKQRRIPNGPFDQTVNDICKECNEGWLNLKVEIPSEQYLDPLVSGDPITTDVGLRQLVSLWAAKTAAVRGLLDPKPRGIPSEHYQWIMNELSPPPHTYVWLGKSEFNPFTMTRHLRFGGWTGENFSRCHMSTFVIGYAALFILGCEDDFGEEIVRSTVEALNSAQLVRLWPDGYTTNTADLPTLSPTHIYELSATTISMPVSLIAELPQ